MEMMTIVTNLNDKWSFDCYCGTVDGSVVKPHSVPDRQQRHLTNRVTKTLRRHTISVWSPCRQSVCSIVCFLVSPGALLVHSLARSLHVCVYTVIMRAIGLFFGRHYISRDNKYILMLSWNTGFPVCIPLHHYAQPVFAWVKLKGIYWFLFFFSSRLHTHTRMSTCVYVCNTDNV